MLSIGFLTKKKQDWLQKLLKRAKSKHILIFWCTCFLLIKVPIAKLRPELRAPTLAAIHRNANPIQLRSSGTDEILRQWVHNKYLIIIMYVYICTASRLDTSFSIWLTDHTFSGKGQAMFTVTTTIMLVRAKLMTTSVSAKPISFIFSCYSI